MQNIHPYGYWPSNITADLLTAQALRLSEPQALEDEVFWLETRPNEKGRNALVHFSANGERTDLLPEPHSIRTRAHEYGGASYLVTAQRIFYILDADQRIYCIERATHKISPLSHEGHYRYADFCWDEKRQRLICVREDHSITNNVTVNKNVTANKNEQSKTEERNEEERNKEERNEEERSEIIAIELNGDIKILVTGADFYSNPRLNPAGDTLSYLCWNHPQMPWDGSECFCAQLNDSGEPIAQRLIAGSKHESIFQPQWSPSGDLFFVSDRNNWWNIYRYNVAQKKDEIIFEMNAEFATPQWIFGMSTYGFLNNAEIFCCYSQQGQWQLSTININNKTLRPILTTFTDIAGIKCHNNKGYFLAANATQASELFCYDNQQLTSLAKSSNTQLAENELSLPQALTYATRDQEIAHAFYFAPKNSQVAAPPHTLPPLIVMCHGGPTGATETSLNIKIQFWTNRGFAVLDVNYRGSTGYGRQYRDRLKQNWGITDVIDVCSGADYLIAQGLVDSNKVAIRGSSAGGYTALAALTFSDTFTVGASLYGIGNLETLAKDTHKFEAHYLDSLIGNYPAARDIYEARSPINHIEKLNCPVIFLQGLQDKVVPPNQAEAMVAALTQKGIKNAYITFPDEGHGFRQANNIKHAIEAELAFYQSIFINIDTSGTL